MRPTPTASAIRLASLILFGAIASDTFAQDRRAAAGDAITIIACVVREADHVRSTAAGRNAVGPFRETGPAASGVAQLLLANAQSGTPTYTLTGVREQELASQVGRQVEISGTVERPRTTPIVATADGSRIGAVNTEAPGATGITPDGAPAHEPSDALSTTVQAGTVVDPQRGASDPAYRVATLPRLNATSFRQVSGTCARKEERRQGVPADREERRQGVPADREERRQGVPADRDGRTASNARVAAAAAPRQVPAPPPLSLPLLTSRASETVTVRGCLVRRTPGGTALTPAADRRDPLALTDASIAGPPSARESGGAPGAGATADRGTGTLPAPVATTGQTPQDAGRMAFALTMAADSQRQLSQLVGERVEIKGTLSDDASTAGGSKAAPEPGVSGRLESTPDAAHPSAPTRTIRVTTFRALGGACR